ncbi:MAG: LysM peptidoglycan-binding domain-containing protein [Luteitalea sp.]|nr:LysM peptidoglycan-binding domain-containing protein [Luteitalea sp.]
MSFLFRPADRRKGKSRGTTAASLVPVTAEQSYTVVDGDSLWKIAGRQLGDGKKWAKIYEANRDKIKDPDIIYPGQVLTMPKA